MKFTSTRNDSTIVSFKQAILNPMPEEGGLFVPCESDDFRKWILYTNNKTSFQSIAGTLTSALINKEFSPLIAERIAAKAFPFEPVLKQLDSNLFVLELFHGPTGTMKDFGVSYLASCMETILHYTGERAVLIDDSSTGALAASLSSALRDKKFLKSVLLFPKGKACNLQERDFVWNGGNIYPVEVDGTEEDCHKLIRSIFEDKELCKSKNITLSNTANIGRLLPQTFFYTYAFSRLKELVAGDIYYALSAGNYGSIIAGLYAWQFALPVHGFIIPATDNLRTDVHQQCTILDSMISFQNRPANDPANPSNLERLEYFFKSSELLKSFVYPAIVTKEQKIKACQELFIKYNYFADEKTSEAYAAAKIKNSLFEDEGAVVLVVQENPLHHSEFIKHNIGELPENLKPVETNRPIKTGRELLKPTDFEALKKIITQSL